MSWFFSIISIKALFRRSDFNKYTMQYIVRLGENKLKQTTNVDDEDDNLFMDYEMED